MELDEDIRERDEFVERMRQREEERTKRYDKQVQQQHEARGAGLGLQVCYSTLMGFSACYLAGVVRCSGLVGGAAGRAVDQGHRHTGGQHGRRAATPTAHHFLHHMICRQSWEEA